MNKISVRVNAILLATVVFFAPAYAVENEQLEVTLVQQQDAVSSSEHVVWYKKRSTYIAAAAATAVVAYAIAVHKNKIVGPIALFTALFCAEKQITEDKDDNNSKNDISKIEHEKLGKQEINEPADKGQANDPIIEDKQLSAQNEQQVGTQNDQESTNSPVLETKTVVQGVVIGDKDNWLTDKMRELLSSARAREFLSSGLFGSEE